jgi:hypothetical protein
MSHMAVQPKTWVAWGLIGAGALPARSLDLSPDVRIEFLDEPRRVELLREAPRAQHPRLPFPVYFSSLPSEVIVRSSHALWVRVKADNHSEAWEIIERRSAPSIVAALAPYGNHAPRIEFLRIGESDQDGVLPTVTSQWIGGTFGGFDTRPLTIQEESTVLARHALGRRHAAEACRLYYDATQQQVRTDRSPRSLGNIVQNYFLVIEIIAQREKLRSELNEADERTAARNIAKLRVSLDDEMPVDSHVKKIRATLRELARLERRHLKDRIEACATRLGLSSSVCDDALRINELRNTTLSHPGKALPEGLEGEVEVAERTARAFLVAFIDSC